MEQDSNLLVADTLSTRSLATSLSDLYSLSRTERARFSCLELKHGKSNLPLINRGKRTW